MRKKWITVLATLFTCATLALGFSACGGGNNSENSDSMNTEQGTNEISFKTLSVDGTNVYGKVSNATEEFSFIDEITAVGTAKFVVSLDVYGAQQVATKVIPLEIGDNTVYITETVDGEPVNVYAVTVRRRPIYKVTIDDGTDTTMQKIEEDGFVSEPAQPTKIGYTFTAWDYDFSKPIMKDTTVKAGWVENAEMSKFNFTSTATTCCIRGIKDKTLTEIIIPDCVTSVGINAFYNCINLTRVVIGNSVTSIDGNAFYGCGNLTSIEISESVTSIGYEAFFGCSSLTSVYITDMAAWCNISFENSIALGSSAANPLFYAEGLYLNNELVTELVIPNSVTSIGDYAFSDYSGLTSVTICDGVTSIGDYAFDSCRNLTSVEISDSVTSIGDYAFDNCRNLTSIEIPNSVMSIGDYAFYDCYKLVEVVNKSAFITVEIGKTSNGYAGCYALAVYNSSAAFTGTKISNDNGYIVYTDGEDKILVGYTKEDRDLVLPAYVTKINQNAFRNCSSLMSVVIGDSITSIGDHAFWDCGSLTSVVIGDSITSIGDYAFYHCRNLTSMEIPDSVTSIGVFAFDDCSSLTSMEIPDGVTSIGGGAFYDCSSLTSMEIPDGVTSIGNYTFDGCSSLTSVVIPDSVTRIGFNAFYYCHSLTNVYYKGTVSAWSATSIDSNNTPLTNATRYYYVENEADVPTDGGNYWHYDENGEVLVW